MPLLFNCQLICDADDCEATQEGVAYLEAGQAAVLSLLGMSDPNPTAPFRVSFDRAQGLEWKVYGDKAACSPRCHVIVEAQLKDKTP